MKSVCQMNYIHRIIDLDNLILIYNIHHIMTNSTNSFYSFFV